MAQQGKPEVVERRVSPEAKDLIGKVGQNPHIFDHTETTPIANQIIDDAHATIEEIVGLQQGIIMSPTKELPKAQTDLLFTAVHMSVAAADEAQHGNHEKAMDFNVAAYAHRCVAEFISNGYQSTKSALNPAEAGKGVIQGAKAEVKRAVIEEHADLAIAYAIIKDLGLGSGETHKAIEAQLARYEQQEHLVYQEGLKDFAAMEATWHENFKDGVALGLARISGSLTGSFVFAPLTVKCLSSATAKMLNSAGKFGPAIMKDLKRINGTLETYRADLQAKAADFQKTLREQFPELGDISIATTPDGIQITMPSEGMSAPVNMAMEGEAVKGGMPAVEAIDATVNFTELKVVPGTSTGSTTQKTIPPVKASDLAMGDGVKKHFFEVVKKGETKGEWSRPYIRQGMNLLIDEIMAAGIPNKDKFLANGLKWVLEGSCNSRSGVWELVIDLDKKEIVHLVFNSKTK